MAGIWFAKRCKPYEPVGISLGVLSDLFRLYLSFTSLISREIKLILLNNYKVRLYLGKDHVIKEVILFIPLQFNKINQD